VGFLVQLVRAKEPPAAPDDHPPATHPTSAVADFERLWDGSTWMTTAYRWTSSGRSRFCDLPLRGYL
jgi:hypothetical protein